MHTLISSKKVWCLRSGCISYERQHCFKSWYLNTLLEGFVTEHCLSVKTEVLLLKTFFFGHVACGILVPRPGIELTPPALEAQSPNHWSVRAVKVVTPHLAVTVR